MQLYCPHNIYVNNTSTFTSKSELMNHDKADVYSHKNDSTDFIGVQASSRMA